MKSALTLSVVANLALALAGHLPAAEPDVPAGARALLAAYPDALTGYRDGKIIWRDGTAMPYDNGRAGKTAAELFENASLKDQLALTYPAGKNYPKPPPRDYDPGRYRHEPFFLKMYGGSASEVEKNLAPVTWMAQTAPQTLRVTRVNHVDERLAAVSAELEATLPPGLKVYATKSEGSYYWRKIAHSDRLSAHSFAIAIDINTAYSDYWQWAHPDAAGHAAYRNRIPWEIVDVFERHGFIWGGKWEHFDTMHFEYRPELLPAAATP